MVKRQTQDDDDEDEDDDDESTQGSTSYRCRKPVFLEDTHEAWMRATGGKTKGRILGMRPGDQSMLSQQSKRGKGKEARQSKQEIERKKKEFDLTVKEAVTKEIEVIQQRQKEEMEREIERMKQQQKIEMEQLEKRLMDRFVAMQVSCSILCYISNLNNII